MKILRKIFSPFRKKAGNIMEQPPKIKISKQKPDEFMKATEKIIYENPETYVPKEHQQFMYDPDVRSFYWNKYWKTTEEGQKYSKENEEIFNKIWAELEAKHQAQQGNT